MALRDEEDQAIKLFGRVIAPSLRKEKRALSHSQEVLGSHSEEHEQSLGGMDDSTVPSLMGTNVVWEEEEGDRKFLLNANNNNNNNDKQVLASSCYSEMDVVQCPRCNSRETKFCYFNNYNPKQPRHFCRACQRYWTAGGNLRNVPIGAGRRKSKRPHTQTNNNNHPYPPSSPPINDNNTLLIRRDSTDYTAAADLSTKEITQDTEEESGGLAAPLEPSSFIERGNIPLLDSSSNGGFYAGPPPLAPPPMMPWPFPGTVWNPYQLGGAIFPWMMMPWMAGANMSPPPPAFFLPPGPNIPEEGSMPLPPKTLRIGDPGAVLKSDFPGFFSAFHPPPQFFQKNLLPTTALFPETPLKPEYSNPVAFSRSVAFQESN